MDLNVLNYKNTMDKQLLELFYRSNFYNRKEFDYARVPENWIYRYKLSKDYIAKIALKNKKIIASLGMVSRVGRIDSKTVNIGCFMDNCILPEYLDDYEDIFSELIGEVEKDAKKIGVSVIQGWDFLEHAAGYKHFWNELGYTSVDGVNCYLGGSDFNCAYPTSTNSNLSKIWKMIIGSYKYKHILKERFLQKLPDGVNLRMLHDNDLENVLPLLNDIGERAEFAPSYDLEELKETMVTNNIFGIIAEKGTKIIGVLTFVNTAWSGWMYGRPYYDKEWKMFYSFIVDEFNVLSEYESTSVPAYMILKMMKIKDPEKKISNMNDYTFAGGIFDRRIKWMREAFLKVGCSEPKYDYGAILAKSLDDDTEIIRDKPWHIPTRCMLAPIPSTQELYKVNLRPV